jgi:acyl dehydratase
MTVEERNGRKYFIPDEKKVFNLPLSRTITESDIATFANLFLSPSIKGREKEAHATHLIPLIDGLCVTGTPPEYNIYRREVNKLLVGDRPTTGGASLGWNNWKLYKSVKPGDTLRVEVELESAWTSRSRENMVIANQRKTAYNQKGEKVVVVYHQSGSW